MHGYAHLMLICTLIAWRMNWETKCSRPTIAWLVERSGLSKPTVKRWVDGSASAAGWASSSRALLSASGRARARA